MAVAHKFHSHEIDITCLEIRYSVDDLTKLYNAFHKDVIDGFSGVHTCKFCNKQIDSWNDVSRDHAEDCVYAKVFAAHNSLVDAMIEMDKAIAEKDGPAT